MIVTSLSVGCVVSSESTTAVDGSLSTVIGTVDCRPAGVTKIVAACTPPVEAGPLSWACISRPE